MPTNVYQSILHDLSLLSEYQLRKVSSYIKEVTKISDLEQPQQPQQLDTDLLPSVVQTDESLEEAKKKNMAFLTTLSPWPTEDFSAYEAELRFNRSEASEERNLEW